MGNQQTKKGEQSPFTSEELKILESSFRHTAGSHMEKITENKLLEVWSDIIDKNLAQFTANFLYTHTSFASPHKPHPPRVQRVGTITFNKYAEPYYIVERGTVDEQINFIQLSLTGKPSDAIDLKELEMYITSVLVSYLHILTSENTAEFNSWHKFGYHCSDRSAQCFAKGLVRQLCSDSPTEVTASTEAMEKWLQVNPTFLIIWRNVFSYLYGCSGNGKISKLGSKACSQILPMQEGLPTGTNYTAILDIPHVIFVNSNMPRELQHKWRFLFSSKIMGESFSTMLGRMLNRGPTLLVIEDEDQYIFAGYAPHSWALGPNFIGNDSAMLFTLSPAMRCFNTTGYNDHYQYLNLNQQTMPNGLGMGGQFGYWGLWLDCEYGIGQSCESCTTFKDYTQLSKRKDFRIKNVEVWGIGDEPKHGEDSDEEEGTNKRSILDQNLEDRVMLELSGKAMHSDGLREPDMDL